MSVQQHSILTLLLLCGIYLMAWTQDKTPQTSQADPMEVGKNWSLFSEYEKNGDCVSAVPYGWKVMKLDAGRFKTLYTRMADCYFSFYDKETSGAKKKVYADTMISILDSGIKYVPERAASFWLRKAYALENYYENRDSAAIAAYEKVLELDFAGTDFAYMDRLGLLYIKNMERNPELKLRAISLYQKVVENLVDKFEKLKVGMSTQDVRSLVGDPNETGETVYEKWKAQRWTYEKDHAILFFVDGKLKGWDRSTVSAQQFAIDRLKRLITDPKELIALAEKKLASDPENLEYIWSTAQAYLQADQLDGAERYLEKLVKKSPKTASYWNELGKIQQRLRKFRQAIDAYENSLKYNDALKENLLNIAVCYRELKNFNSARTYALRAASRERGWGQPYMHIGEIYKAAVEDCILSTKAGDWTKLDLNDKLVYKLAQDSFLRAKAVEPGLANEADTRVRELSTLVPTKEDYFFNRDRIREDKMDIQSPCYGWIGEPVSVPSLK